MPTGIDVYIVCLHFEESATFEDVCRSGHVSTCITSTQSLNCDGVGVVSVKIRNR